MRSLVQNEILKKTIRDDLHLVAREAKLQGFEIIKDIILTNVEWLPDTGLVTPTLKLKRAQLRDYYQEEI